MLQKGGFYSRQEAAILLPENNKFIEIME